MAEDSSLFGKLPPELINEVLKFLPVQDRLLARLVCSRWEGLATLGMKFLVHVNDQTLETSMKSRQRVETLYARDLRNPLPVSYRRKVIQNFTFLQRMFFGPNITNSNMKKLLEQVQQVDTLGFSYEQPPSFSGLRFLNLTCLQFQKLKLCKSQALAFKKLLSNVNFPALRRFNLIHIDVSDFRVYLAIYLFVVNHAKTLKNLIINVGPEEVKNVQVDERFRRLYESCEKYLDVSSRLCNVDLDTIWINACNFEGLSPWNLSCKLVAAQRNLECLLLDGMWFSQAIQRTGVINIGNLLEKNHRTLKRLKLPITELDGRLVHRCQGLEEIGVYIPFDQLKAFGLTGIEGCVRNYQFFPRSLKMVDMHIPMDKRDVLWISAHIPVEDLVCEGLRDQRWDWESFLQIWSSQSLTNFRSYTKMSISDVQKLQDFIFHSKGIDGQIEYNQSTRFALVDISIDRTIFVVSES